MLHRARPARAASKVERVKPQVGVLNRVLPTQIQVRQEPRQDVDLFIFADRKLEVVEFVLRESPRETGALAPEARAVARVL